MPITMQTSVATQDTSYLRQNQLGANRSASKAANAFNEIPNNADIEKMVASALELGKQNINLDRGAILNILA